MFFALAVLIKKPLALSSDTVWEKKDLVWGKLPITYDREAAYNIWDIWFYATTMLRQTFKKSLKKENNLKYTR